MANAENALKARMGKLKKRADELGVFYNDNTDEATLREAINEASNVEEKAEPQQSQQLDIAELGKVLAKTMANEMRQVIHKESDGELYDERDIDPADVTTEKVYFAPMFFWIVPAKRVGSQMVKPPHRKMIFKMDNGGTVQVGDQWQTRYMSTFITNSKREQVFLETHPLFNRVFFTNSREAAISSDQVVFAQKFSQHYNALGTKMAPELYRLGAQHGIRLDSKMSLPTLRTNIANELTKRDVAAEELHRKELMKASSRSELITPSVGQ
jgi:hypothetical protein